MFSTRIPIIIAAAVVLGCSESAVAPIAQSDFPTLQASVGSQVVHRATAGGPDLCAAFGAKPGCDANYSLHALERADGSVTGQYHDQFAQFPGFGGNGFHAAVNCLNVIGNQAWVSGVVTQSRIPGLVGLDVVTTVVDNGRSANDPADQISFSFIGTGIDCNAAPAFGLPLLSVPQGQVTVE
jgi:hypothetical protein